MGKDDKKQNTLVPLGGVGDSSLHNSKFLYYIQHVSPFRSAKIHKYLPENII